MTIVQKLQGICTEISYPSSLRREDNFLLLFDAQDIVTMLSQ